MTGAGTAGKEAPETGLKRRSFLSWLWIGLGVVALAEVAAAVAAFLRLGRTRSGGEGFGGVVAAGDTAAYEPNTVTPFVQGHFYLARLEDGGFLALSRKCTHLGCSLVWEEKQGRFICPCHASEFDIRGEVLRSPAPRALDTYPIRIENNCLFVDTRAPVRRRGYAPEQAVFAEPA